MAIIEGVSNKMITLNDVLFFFLFFLNAHMVSFCLPGDGGRVF